MLLIQDLAVGQHEIVCIVISIGKKLSASDAVEIYEEITPEDKTTEESEGVKDEPTTE